jgi:NACalpha-BTF3-like transcription factor
MGSTLNNEYIIEDPDEFMQKMKRDPQGSGSKKKDAEKINEKDESENEYSWDPDFD